MKSALLYVGIVFGGRFFGVIGTLWVVPLVGVMWAERLEAPLMLAVIVLAARSVVRSFELASRPVALVVGVPNDSELEPSGGVSHGLGGASEVDGVTARGFNPLPTGRTP